MPYILIGGGFGRGSWTSHHRLPQATTCQRSATPCAAAGLEGQRGRMGWSRHRAVLHEVRHRASVWRSAPQRCCLVWRPPSPQCVAGRCGGGLRGHRRAHRRGRAQVLREVAQAAEAHAGPVQRVVAVARHHLVDAALVPHREPGPAHPIEHRHAAHAVSVVGESSLKYFLAWLSASSLYFFWSIRLTSRSQ